MKKISALLAVFIAALLPTLAFAQEGGKLDESAGLLGIAAALVMGIAALGGTMAQGKAAAAALEGIGRNPGAAGKIQTPMILGLALIESLVIFSFVIAIQILGKF